VMLGQLKHVINASFANFTGFECDDVSAKLAVLSLQHPAGMAIKEKFEILRKMYEDHPSLGHAAIPEMLCWNTGRFGGKTAFIVDRIQNRSI
jgi:hypothetical protein